MLKILLFSSLFPNAAQPLHGLFVEQRLRKALETGRAEARVVAPVPWFPFKAARFGDYATFARVPAREVRQGLVVDHPRFLRLPKLGMSSAPLAMALGALKTLRSVRAEGFDFDVIDAHYYYPDGVAAAMLGRWLNRPVAITARGTDINLIPEYWLPRLQIQWASRHAAANIAVCKALAREMARIGIDASHLEVLRNGVDLELFRPIDRNEARMRVGLDPKRWLLSVGRLDPVKGNDLTLQALRKLPTWSLVIVGNGPEEKALRNLARQLGVDDRVVFVGGVPQKELPFYYSAADALVLSSSREGWANVLLEAMACGTPVIASSVWGTPEVVTDDVAGRLMRERSPAGLIEALESLMADYPARDATRSYATRFSWVATADAQITIFKRLAGRAA